MASLLNEFGAYQPPIVSLDPGNSVNFGFLGSGSGAPDANTSSSLLGYIDNDTGDFYLYVNGVWTQLAGSQYGHGSPEGAVDGGFGSVYTDIDNGAFYVKTSDTGNTGWVAVTGGAVSDKLKLVSGDPNGVTTGTRPDIGYDTAGRVWLKTGAGANNTGWEQLMGPPV